MSGLKGRDRAVAAVLQLAGSVELMLALVEKHEHGSSHDSGPSYGYGYGGRRGRGYYDEDDYEDYGGDASMDEVHESSISVEKWVAEDDSTCNLNLTIERYVDSRVSPPSWSSLFLPRSSSYDKNLL